MKQKTFAWLLVLILALTPVLAFAEGEDTSATLTIDAEHIYPDMDKPLKARRRELRDKVYRTMCKRAERSDHIQIRYIKRENNSK